MPDLIEPEDHADDAIEHSPLEREITRDGVTVQVFIYRGRADLGWLLEIEDEAGRSTCWEEMFDTDQAALDEALRSIDEEGIHSFCDVQSDPAAMRNLWNPAAAQPAIAELRRTLDASAKTISFHRACGVLAALASTPDFRAPSEWLDIIRGDLVFANVADVERFTHGVMTLYNEVVRSVNECGAHCCPPPEEHDALQEFCKGYLEIASSETKAFNDPKALMSLLPICTLAGTVPLDKVAEELGETPEQWLQSCREELADDVLSLHAYWQGARDAAAEEMRQRSLPHRRAAPKVGRNERCPCGSGKKFKKCCAA